MNGSIGCLPDNNEVCYTLKDALEFARFLFDDIEERFITNLKNNRIHYFSDCAGAGADYIEISDKCYDVDCLNDDN